MNHGCFWKLACVVLLLSAACGDDDQGMADPAATRDERDGGGSGSGGQGRDEGEGDPADEDDPASAGRGSAGRGGDTPEGGDGAGEDEDQDEDPPAMDAATPPGETPDAGGGDEPGDASAGQDAAAPVMDCESLAACCEQLVDRRQMMCRSVVEAGEDRACVAFARRTCSGDGDVRPPTPMPCEAVLECCDGLEQRERVACEAAAAAPEGRACERAMEMYCR